MSRLSLWRLCRTALGLGVLICSGAIARAEGGASGQGLQSAVAQLQMPSQPGKVERLAPVTIVASAATACPTQATACPPAQTSCPTAATRCPAISTRCPAKETACPAETTACPATETKCPPSQT